MYIKKAKHYFIRYPWLNQQIHLKNNIAHAVEAS